MPINIPKNLPVGEQLRKEKIFVMEKDRAKTQQIRPLNILICNLMPEKEKTELQLLRLLGNTPSSKHHILKYSYTPIEKREKITFTNYSHNI